MVALHRLVRLVLVEEVGCGLVGGRLLLNLEWPIELHLVHRGSAGRPVSVREEGARLDRDEVHVLDFDVARAHQGVALVGAGVDGVRARHRLAGGDARLRPTDGRAADHRLP